MKIDSSAWLAKGSIVLGDVTIGKDVGIWYNAVVRGDTASIVIGDGSNVQDNAVVHVDANHPTTIGAGVTIGHGAIVHGCTIGDNTVIGMGAIILNDAVVGKNCTIGAGALVSGGTVIPDNSIAFGNPAKIRREMRPEEIEFNKHNAQVYVEHVYEHKAEEEDR